MSRLLMGFAVALMALAVPLAGASVLAQECTPDMSFVADVTVPDDTVMQPGDRFTKTWRLRNSGTCEWTEGYALVFVAGDPLGVTSPQPLSDAVAPGEDAELSIDMQAPEADGVYSSWWQVRDGEGNLFGERVYIRIVVVMGGSVTALTPAVPKRELDLMSNRELADALGIELGVSFPGWLVGRSRFHQILQEDFNLVTLTWGIN